MPKITDVETVKKRIVTAAWAVIANEGIQSVSMRRIAAEAGCTTGLITHYFSDKDELVTYAYRLVLDDMIAAASRRIAGSGSIEKRLLAAIEAIEPTGSRMKQFTIVLMNFWAQAAFNRSFAKHCRHDYARWRALIAGTIRNGIDSGELRPRTDVRRLTDVLTLLSDGFSVGMTLTPERYPERRRRAIIHELLRPYLVRGTSRASRRQ